MQLQYSVLALTALLLAAAPRARADNWSQFRHDRGRTGASQDPVRFPVMPLWQWSTRGRSNYTPLSHAAIAAGVLYFVAADGASRVLLALDARSGRELWRQPLAAVRLGHPLTDQVAPTVDGSRVLVYDWVSRSGEPGAPKFLVGGKPATGFLIRSFNAATGIEDVGAALTQLGARGALSRLNLPFDRLRPDPYSLVLFTAGPLPEVTNASARVPRLPELLGPPLVDGGNFFATSLSEMICRWTPGADPQMSRVHRPIPPPYALHSAAAFSGAPPVAAGPGWIITDGKQNHMVAGLDQQGRTLWHRYLPFPIGVPAGDDRQVYLPLGKPDGTEAILVLDAADGAEKWLFSPQTTSRRIVLSEPIPPVPPVNVGIGGAGGTPSAGRSVRQNFNIVDQRAGVVSHGQRGVFRFGGNGSFGTGPAPGVRGSPLGGRGFAGAGFGGASGSGNPVSAGSSAGAPGIRAQGAPNRTVYPLSGLSNHQDNSTLRLWLNQQRAYEQAARREAMLAATQYQRLQKQALDMLVGETQVYPLHPGLVVSGGRVFGIVKGALWAIDTEIGRPLWGMPLPPRSRVHSLIASRGHLVLCVSDPPAAQGTTGDSGGDLAHWVVALHQETGRPVWETPVGQPGNLATADGLVYFMNGDLTVFAPAERTFAVASDSASPSRYQGQKAGAEKLPPAADGAEQSPNPATAPGEMGAGGSGSAAPTGTQLRLTWGADVESLAAQVRARRGVLPGVPLLLSLDWLSPDRSTRRGPGAWSPAMEANFVLVCRRLAAEGRPEFFDLAPEVNAYLARHPGATPGVARMLGDARAAIRGISPGTRTMASWNVELLLGRYGQGAELPFGQILVSSQGADPSRFAEAVDAVGLTLRPGAAFRQPQQVPRDYLTGVRYRFPNHPLLIADVGFGANTVKPDAEALILRALRSGYWLDAQWVCVPESVLDATRDAADAPDHPVSALRDELLALTQVDRLTAGQPQAP